MADTQVDQKSIRVFISRSAEKPFAPGYLRYMGTLISQTDSTIKLRTPSGHLTSRAKKGTMFIMAECDDPLEVIKRWRDVWKSYDAELEEKRHEIMMIQDRRKTDAMFAAFQTKKGNVAT